MRAGLFVIVLALAAPSAAATWYVAGTFEPDTSYDSPQWMFAAPPPAGVAAIYLNGVTVTKGSIGVTPNVGLLETRNEAPVSESYFVFFGVWNDCNGDGYIGAAEQALREYPAALLASTASCPPSTGLSSTWTAGAHNYNGWVSEFVWLARGGNGQRMYIDADLRVWGDYERPDHAPKLGWCPTTPLPRGTLQSTGGLLGYAHCRLEQRGIDETGSWNDAMAAVGDPLGLRFEDEHDTTSGPVGQIPTFGTEDQSHSPAYVWDCDAAPTTVGPVAVSAVDPRLGNTDPTQWTLPAFYNHTYDGIRAVDDCDWTNDRAGGFYLNEADYNPVNPRNKTEADWNFNFAPGQNRGTPPGGTVLGPGPAGAPFDGGLGWTFHPQHPGWAPDNSYGGKLGPATVRASLEDGVRIADSYWVTYYAQLGQATLDRGFPRPVNTGGTYGEWQCGAHPRGIHPGWTCDADAWYRNPDGSAYVTTSPLVRVGHSYDLRDVDCYDGNTRAGVAIGVTAYGEDPCI